MSVLDTEHMLLQGLLSGLTIFVLGLPLPKEGFPGGASFLHHAPDSTIGLVLWGRQGLVSVQE